MRVYSFSLLLPSTSFTNLTDAGVFFDGTNDFIKSLPNKNYSIQGPGTIIIKAKYSSISSVMNLKISLIFIKPNQ